MAKGHSTASWVRIEPATLRSRVRRSHNGAIGAPLIIRKESWRFSWHFGIIVVVIVIMIEIERNRSSLEYVAVMKQKRKCMCNVSRTANKPRQWKSMLSHQEWFYLLYMLPLLVSHNTEVEIWIIIHIRDFAPSHIETSQR